MDYEITFICNRCGTMNVWTPAAIHTYGVRTNGIEWLVAWNEYRIPCQRQGSSPCPEQRIVRIPKQEGQDTSIGDQEA